MCEQRFMLYRGCFLSVHTLSRGPLLRPPTASASRLLSTLTAGRCKDATLDRWFNAVDVYSCCGAVTVAAEQHRHRSGTAHAPLMNALDRGKAVAVAGLRKHVDHGEEASAAMAAHVVMFSSRTCAPRLRHHLATAEWMASLMSARAS